MTSTTHPLPFENLSGKQFEDLCFGLVLREGYKRAEAPGQAGRDLGIDIFAFQGSDLIAFECKRRKRFPPSEVEHVIEKVLRLPPHERPTELVLIAACNVSREARERGREKAGSMRFQVWALTELDQRVKRFRDLVRLFFGSSILDESSGATSEIFVAQMRSGIEDVDHAYERDYRLALLTKLDYMELSGIDIFSKPDLKLSTAYVSLNLSHNSDLLTTDALLDQLTPDTGRLLVRGEAGSGKSTLCRWAAISASKYRATAAPAPAAYWRARIPFLVSARDCSTGRIPLDVFSRELVGETLPRDWVKRILTDRRALILLDGLDEISKDARDTLRREINFLALRYPGNHLIVTTRPNAVERGWLNSLGFREAHIFPMSLLERDLLIARWFQAVAAGSNSTAAEREIGDWAKSLSNQLNSNPEIARLARNPLLCAMICALYWEGREVPDRPRGLCEALCHALLHSREKESTVDAFPKTNRPLEYSQKRAIIQDLAAFMVIESVSDLSIGEFRERLAEALETIPGSNAEEVEHSLLARSALLREEKPGKVSFIHNTFKELLAGDYLAKKKYSRLVAENSDNLEWHPVILFAVASGQTSFVSRVIRRILQRDQMPGWSPLSSQVDTRAGTQRRARHLLALRCQAVASQDLDSDLKEELARLANDLLPPRTAEDAEALASAGEVAVPFLLFRGTLSEPEAAACVRALGLIGTPEAREAIRSYLGDDRRAVISELVQIVNPLEITWVREQLFLLEKLPEGICAQVVDLAPLSHLTDLRILDLSGSRVRDLRALGEIRDLAILNLSDTPVSDLSPLSKLASLQELELAGTLVENLCPLSELGHLRYLNLSHTPVKDLSPLSRLNSLKRLSLVGSQVVDISSVAKLKRLKYLYLAGTQVVDVSPLAELKGLKYIDLQGTPVTDLTPLMSLQQLEMLDISGTQVPDSTFLKHLGFRVFDGPRTAG